MPAEIGETAVWDFFLFVERDHAERLHQLVYKNHGKLG